jgi:hypothetical protein
MYCSGCGFALAPGQPVCPQCGRPAAAYVPPVPGMNFLVDSYANKVRTLGVFWFAYAGLNLLLGLAGMAFMHAFISNRFGFFDHGSWSHGAFPFGPLLLPAMLRFAWVVLTVRVGLAVAAGWGLMERAPWGRFVALVAAFFSILKFPLGTALAIFTFVLLLGYRNNALYSQLPQRPLLL